MKITTSWPEDPWNVYICWFGWEIRQNVKCRKMTICRRFAVMKILKFFDFLESLLKWWKSPPVDHRTLEMCIFADLGEKYAKMWNAQKWQFVAGPQYWKSSNFPLSGKPLKMMETTTSWPQDPWNVHICWFGWEICKNVKCPKVTFFSHVRGHGNL